MGESRGRTGYSHIKLPTMGFLLFPRILIGLYSIHRLAMVKEIGEVEDLMSAGIIDPTKVVRIALENASSIASLLITTEALVTEKPEEEKHPPMPPGGGMY